MVAKQWQLAVDELQQTLSTVSFRDRDGRELDPDTGFSVWRDMTERLRAACGTIYLVGNGASASMASHISADLAKNGHLHTQVFTDISLITAVANDISYDQVFAEPLRTRANPGDMLVAISSSGASSNVLAATNVAIDLEVAVVTVSAMREDNPLRATGHLNVYVPASTYGMAESCHATILHRWMDLVALDS